MAQETAGKSLYDGHDTSLPALQGLVDTSSLGSEQDAAYANMFRSNSPASKQFSWPVIDEGFSLLTGAMDPMWDIELPAQYQSPSTALNWTDGEVISQPASEYHQSSQKCTPQSISSRLNAQFQPLQRPRSPIARSLDNYDSVLVEYYFSNVATLYSCFDGHLNTFRTAVSRLWHSSELVMWTLQSMAAACLARELPHLAQKGLDLRKQAALKARHQLQGEGGSSIILLCLIMLGQSASWHDPSDLGLCQYLDANQLFESHVAKDMLEETNHHDELNSTFLGQSLTYWAMVLSFVSGVGRKDTAHIASGRTLRLPSQIIPHPWTLVAPDLMATVSEVGQLLYTHRKECLRNKFWKHADVSAIGEDISRARNLENQLFHHRLPCEGEIADPGDESAPVCDFISVARAYQLCTLLQIYRVFPDILDERRALTSHVHDVPDILLSGVDGPLPASEANRDVFLEQFALKIIKILAGIPFESHTRSIQSFLYVALSSELRVPSAEDIQIPHLQVINARSLIRSRLEAYHYVFAPRPAQRKLDIVLKVWESMDQSSRCVYWMDVMVDNGLEVVFC